MIFMKGKILVFFGLLLASGMLFASEPHENEAQDEDFNVTDFVMNHIKDSHNWHILEYTDKTGKAHAVSIPLPVILIHEGKPVCFMSSKFHHGHAVVTKNGNHYFLHEGTIYVTDENGTIEESYDEEKEATVIVNEKPMDFSITKNVAGMFVTALIMLLVFISVARAYKKRPGRPAGLQGFMEPLILFVRDDIAKPNIGEKYERYLPYILTVFFFILINNLLGLVPFFPGGANITGNISVTLTLALFTMIATNISGSKAYWKHIFNAPGVPWWLKFPIPIMPVVEFIGILSKPFALMIRLFANITAGHIIVMSLVAVIFIFKAIGMSAISVPFVLFIDVLEILVAFIQAYIFTLLSCLFIGLAVQSDH
ncbi:MAG: F0F1 ATP synthase subunit A [Bacteroidales bacterium]|nr:F0F1 ATP synthase subunit A [Bacteroidales bacterium]